MKYDDFHDVDIFIYNLALEYLPNLNIPGLSKEVISSYLTPTNDMAPKDINDVYKRMLLSLQNAERKSKVIGGSIGGIEKLAPLLFDFSPQMVLAAYVNSTELLNAIGSKFNSVSKYNKSDRGLWPQFCQSILSAAKFIEQFSSLEDFTSWIRFFDNDDRARYGLPLLISNAVHGLGLALSCDFLKEIGYVNFPKPDVHLRSIFSGLNLCPEGSDDYYLLKAIVRLARNAKVTPYSADKLFWMIGSGKFENHKHIGENGFIGRKYRDDFIEHAKSKLIEDGIFL